MASKKKFTKPKKEQPEKFRHKLTVTARTDGQKRYIQDIQNSEIILCTGPAGSGKTVIAVGMALQSLFAGEIDQIVIMRPVREACDEKIGFLPGNLEDKMGPWAAPVIDNLKVFLDTVQIRNLLATKRIETIPLAYARGRSLNRCHVIVDEAQNCSPKQLLMILTRIGDGSKMIINGDTSQSDIPSEGLSDAIRRLKGMRKVAISSMDSSDIVRNPLIAEIIDRYKDS